ncbi:hypothetical protein EV424DRAFT_1349184 [Suillus variegatus]|nr:hypothetical protein EV424DRAFT_1349184 [Suillus variegatus]
MNPLLAEWALVTTHIASNYVCHQCCAIVRVTPRVLPPPELNAVLLMACSHLVRILAEAYHNPVTINLDMANTMVPSWCNQCSFSILEHVLNTNEKWCTYGSNFQTPKFYSKVSASLKQDDGLAIYQAMWRLVALGAAALRVMHSGLYWSSLTTQMGWGNMIIHGDGWAYLGNM